MHPDLKELLAELSHNVDKRLFLVKEAQERHRTAIARFDGAVVMAKDANATIDTLTLERDEARARARAPTAVHALILAAEARHAADPARGWI